MKVTFLFFLLATLAMLSVFQTAVEATPQTEVDVDGLNEDVDSPKSQLPMDETDQKGHGKGHGKTKCTGKGKGAGMENANVKGKGKGEEMRKGKGNGKGKGQQAQ